MKLWIVSITVVVTCVSTVLSAGASADTAPRDAWKPTFGDVHIVDQDTVTLKPVYNPEMSTSMAVLLTENLAVPIHTGDVITFSYRIDKPAAACGRGSAPVANFSARGAYYSTYPDCGELQPDGDFKVTYPYTGPTGKLGSFSLSFEGSGTSGATATMEHLTVDDELIVFQGTSACALELNATLTGHDQKRGGDNRLRVTTDARGAAAGAQVRYFRRPGRGRILVGEGTLNGKGVSALVVDDVNHTRENRYVARVLPTSRTCGDRTDRIRVR